MIRFNHQRSVICALALSTVLHQVCIAAESERLWRAICQKESSNNHKAYNKKEKAAGIAQIRPICLRDCNRIAGYRRWTLKDRYDVEKSREMFFSYTTHYSNTGSDEERAKTWNGGPRGAKKISTLTYWRDVKAIMEK